MSALLNKRLARSLWRTKLRLLAVVLMVSVGVFAGITFGGYSHNLDGMYETLQGDDEEGANLADLWIDNRSASWTSEEVATFCGALESSWPSTGAALDSCEGRSIVQGTMFHTNESGTHIINSLWHGIPEDANADKVWMPDGHSEGRVASSADEIVIDAHVVEALDLSLGDAVVIGAGTASAEFTIVGIGYHPLHVFMAPEGSLFPPEAGQYVVGYLSDSGMARLTNTSLGSSNTLLLDVEGTPSFDLPDTEGYEGDEIDTVKALVSDALVVAELDGRVRDRGQNEPVEIMRQDLEGAKRTSIPFTVMIAAIASITIVLSLQRLVQSQAKEIAVLRTLGVNRISLMTGYLIAPLAIGAVGCGLGALMGPWGVNGMLDFYEGIVGLPITEREVPLELYTGVMLPTMLVVFLSGAFPAWKSSRLDPLEVLSGQNQMRVGSTLLRRLTSWMPTTLGLSIRSSVRKPVRLMMTFLAVGISLMLFGSVQMMSAGLQDTIVGGLEEQQSWDAQVYIGEGGEASIIEWADERGATYESLIEMPLGSVDDADGLERVFTLVGFDSYETGMRNVNVIEGERPQSSSGPSEVMMDEGSMVFLGWSVGEQHTVLLNGAEHDITVVGTTRGELVRTMYFLRADLGEALGVEATSMYLTLPEGVAVDASLAEISMGVIERQTLIDGMNSLIEQQTQIFQAMMYLGLMFTIAVMFNTMIMNVAERDFELATLRVLGASTRSLGFMLLFESLLIGIIGGLVGVAFAYGGAVGLAASFSSWQFFVAIVVVPSVAYQLMTGVIVIAVAMTPIGIWRLRRMDLVEKVKDLSQ
ncbi:MAG: FtsX-like permease family protein [Candidatus Thermoplasmatota archaeon]|nr:FtsX-like permease family protein [Candidatus Thermoplasmatota archaeon]MEC8680776.1 FtsX-like permease family protein [Candidatus Thermoplasmatota archaeon]